MRYRNWSVVVLVALLLSAVPAQAQQSFDVNLGLFAAKPEDSRVAGDVLVVNRGYLLFEFDDLVGGMGELGWSTELGKYFELGLSGGINQISVPAVYAEDVHDDGREIEQDLKLRVAPVTAMLRIFPMGHRRSIQPYVGIGVAANMWRYSESGEFVDYSDRSIYRETYSANGTEFGPVGVLGVRGRISNQVDVGLEYRASWGEADLNADDFLSDKLDLGGSALLATIKFRF